MDGESMLEIRECDSATTSQAAVPAGAGPSGVTGVPCSCGRGRAGSTGAAAEAGGEELASSEASSSSFEDAFCYSSSSAGASGVVDAGESSARKPREFGLGEYGCGHYRRRCMIVAPCCDEVFWCRHCHNEAKCANEKDPEKAHEIDRRAIREVICAVCDERQPAAPDCRLCGVSFGAYSCMECNFWDDDTSKQQYHCEHCGICRVGGRENFFHCHTCGSCYSTALRESHACVQNSMMQNCPVCLEYLFDSVKPISVLRCGHTIHESCLQQLRLQSEPGHPSSYTCPMCAKSIYDMSSVWLELDQSVAANPMAPEYENIAVKIACKDCHSESEVPFHVWLKCQSCGSYNTRKV